MSAVLPQPTETGEFGRRGWTTGVATVLALVVATGAAGWLSLERERQLLARERDREQVRLAHVAVALTSEINQRQALLSALVAFGELHGEDAGLRNDFAVFAAGLRANDPAIRLVQLFPPEGPVLAYPQERNQSVLERTLGDLMADDRPEVRADVQRAIATGRVTLSGPYDLRQGGYGLVARQPVLREGRLWGLATVVLDLPALFARAGLPQLSTPYRLALADGDGRVFHGDPTVLAESPVQSRIQLPEGTWTVSAVPHEGWADRIAPGLRTVQLGLLAVVLLVTGLVYAISRRQTALARAVELRTAELRLREAEARLFSEEANGARQAAELSRSQITETMDRISDGFATLDREWRYTFVNLRLAQLVGRSREELLGRCIWSEFPELVGTPVHDAFLRAMHEQQPVEQEYFYAPLQRWFEHRIYPSPPGLSVFSRDITDLKAVADALKASQEHFQRLVMEAPLPLCFVAHDGTLQLMNERFVLTFGYTPADLPTIEHWWKSAYPDAHYREEVVARWSDALARSGRIRDVEPAEYRVTRKDGRVLRVEIAGTSMRGGFLASFVDVTERREAEEQAQSAQRETARLLVEAENSRRVLLSVIEDQKETEAALRRNEERYRGLVETSFDWIWEVDTQSRYVYSSPRVTELLGYPVEQVLGQTPFDFMLPAEAGPLRAESERIAAARQPFVSLESSYCHRDGRLVVLETNGVPVYAPDGTWLGYRGMARDITARRAAEARLRLHGAALEAAANAVVIADRTGAIEWVNPAFTSLSGWSLPEVVGKNPREFLKSGEHGPEFYRHLWKTVSAGRVWRGEIVNRRKDGRLRTEDMTITPLRDAGGDITHFIAIKQDITEHKVMEQQFLQAQRMEAIGTLAGGIAHDLNNILAPILMIAEVLKDKLANEADRSLLALTQVSAKRGADIVKQLLAFSRGQPGERSVVQSRHLIKEIMQMMRETFPRDIELRHRPAEKLWTVTADPTQLQQVLLNLCVNARDAMPSGGRLTIEASNVRLTAGDPVLPRTAHPGPYIAIDVSDTGSGIPPQIKHRIFDPFFTTKEVGKGTGLGLSTVLGIVQQHGGFVTVDSTMGQGTTFRVHLPANPETTEAKAEPEKPTTRSPFTTSRGQTLLLVDDEPEIRETARVLLEQRGFRILSAAQGEEALTRYLERRAEIRLVITDLMMPIMGGMPLIRALRALDGELPIVVTSGLNDLHQRQELAALGVKEILSKPYDGSVLFDALRRCLPEENASLGSGPRQP